MNPYYFREWEEMIDSREDAMTVCYSYSHNYLIMETKVLSVIEIVVIVVFLHQHSLVEEEQIEVLLVVDILHLLEEEEGIMVSRRRREREILLDYSIQMG